MKEQNDTQTLGWLGKGLALRISVTALVAAVPFTLYGMRRAPFWQRLSIKRKMSRAAFPQHMFSETDLIQRHKEISSFNHLLVHNPVGPITFVGPEASGKTLVLRECLANRPWVIYFNYFQNELTSTNFEDFLYIFFKRCGFCHPMPFLYSIGAIKHTQDHRFIENHRAIRAITEVLQAHKAKGYRHSGNKVVPIIVLDEIQQWQALDNAQATGFVSWLISLSERELAHVVLSGRKRNDVLHKFTDFKMREVYFYMPYLEKHSALEAIASKGFSQEDSLEIFEAIGANFRDLKFLSVSKDWRETMQLLVNKSENRLISHFSDLMHRAFNKKTKENLKPIIRYIKVVDTLATKGHLSHNDLISIFSDLGLKEIYDLENSRILRLVYHSGQLHAEGYIPRVQTACRALQQDPGWTVLVRKVQGHATKIDMSKRETQLLQRIESWSQLLKHGSNEANSDEQAREELQLLGSLLKQTTNLFDQIKYKEPSRI